MMHPHQLHSLGKLYHEEAIKEARVRNLKQPAIAHRRPRSEGQGHRTWLSKLAAAAFGAS